MILTKGHCNIQFHGKTFASCAIQLAPESYVRLLHLGTLFYETCILNWNWDQSLAVPTCRTPTSSDLRGQERSLSLIQLRYFLLSNLTEFHLIPSSSHSTEKHSQLLLAYIGCQTADCLDYTGLYCIPAGTIYTKCFLWDQGSLQGYTKTPGAVLNLEIPRQQAVLHMLLSKTLSLELLKVQPTPNQLPKQPKLMVNLYSLWLSPLQQRDPVLCGFCPGTGN